MLGIRNLGEAITPEKRNKEVKKKESSSDINLMPAKSILETVSQVPERADHLLLRCPGLNNLRAECFKTWLLDAKPEWEVDWILKFLGNPTVEGLEDPTNTPEEISGRGSEAESGRSSSTSDY